MRPKTFKQYLNETEQINQNETIQLNEFVAQAIATVLAVPLIMLSPDAFDNEKKIKKANARIDAILKRNEQIAKYGVDEKGDPNLSPGDKFVQKLQAWFLGLVGGGMALNYFLANYPLVTSGVIGAGIALWAYGTFFDEKNYAVLQKKLNKLLKEKEDITHRMERFMKRAKKNSDNPSLAVKEKKRKDGMALLSELDSVNIKIEKIIKKMEDYTKKNPEKVQLKESIVEAILEQNLER